MNEIKDKVSERCFETSDRILNILEGLQYTSERKPSYENELRDLVAIEVRRNINDVVTDFYKNAALAPAAPEVEVIDVVGDSVILKQSLDSFNDPNINADDFAP